MFTTDCEKQDLLDLSEEDFTYAKKNEFYKLKNPFLEYSDDYTLTEWLETTDLKTYKENLELLKLQETYEGVDIKAGAKVSSEMFLNFIFKYIDNEKQKGKEDIFIKTVTRIKKDIINLFNVKYQNSLYVFSAKRTFGFSVPSIKAGDGSSFDKNILYSKEDIKQHCFQGGLSYKSTLEHFDMIRQRVKTEDGKTVQKKLYKLKSS